MSKRGIKPQKRVSTDWTTKLSYAVGLIASDGYLSVDRRHINFTSKDEDLITVFSECLGLKNKIGKKTNGYNKKNYYQIQFGDVNFYKWLLKIGLSSKKSKTIGRLKIPDELFFDFLRGYFDGDGSIHSFWDPRWHSSYMFYLQFSSGSIVYLKWLQEIIYKFEGILGKIQKSSRAHQLVYAKKGTRILVERMFYRQSVPCLARKFLKIQNIFKIDDEHNSLARVEKLVDSGA